MKFSRFCSANFLKKVTIAILMVLGIRQASFATNSYQNSAPFVLPNGNFVAGGSSYNSKLRIYHPERGFIRSFSQEGDRDISIGDVPSEIDYPSLSEEDRCPICLEDLKENKIVKLHKCSVCANKFHQGCIDSWIIKDHNTCPLCRRNINVVNVDANEEININQALVNRCEGLENRISNIITPRDIVNEVASIRIDNITHQMRIPSFPDDVFQGYNVELYNQEFDSLAQIPMSGNIAIRYQGVRCVCSNTGCVEQPEHY